MNTDEFLSNMQSSFPHIYNVYDHNTILYALLSVYASKFGAKEDIINRVYAMMGIDSTYDEDLEHRWGSLLGIYKNNGESFRDYRARLMIVYASLTGGTEEAIKYAVASAIGISSDQDMINEYIHIYDAWAYYDSDIKPNPTDPTFEPLTNSAINKTNDGFVLNKPYDIHKYGAFVCTIDLTVDEGIAVYHDKVMRAINQTKASGIAAYLVLLYITNELCTIHTDEVDIMKVNELSADIGNQSGIDTDNVIVEFTNNESGSMSSIKSNEDSMIINYADSIDTNNARIDEYLIGTMSKRDSDHGHIPSAKRVFNPILNCGVMLNGNFVTNRLSEFADVDDKLTEKASQTIQEKGTCTLVTTKAWYPLIGIHTDVVLNTDFRTNMLLETDMCKDVIKQI